MFITLFLSSSDIFIAAYSARFPPFEWPPILIFSSLYSFKIFLKYLNADFCAGISSLKLKLKSSFQPTIVSSVPLNETYKVPSGKIKVKALNCSSVFTSILLTYFATRISWYLFVFAILCNKSGSRGLKTTFSLLVSYVYLSFNS